MRVGLISAGKSLVSQVEHTEKCEPSGDEAHSGNDLFRAKNVVEQPRMR
jgi:hypothetical protein